MQNWFCDIDLREARRTSPANGRRTLCYFPCIFALLLLASTCGTSFAATETQRQQSVTLSRGSFTVADFDGDHEPDFAVVQPNEGSPSAGRYWVWLRLSQSGRRYVRVAAPGGGVSIEARDVNGDSAIDLVVATAWLNKPVAVLLNDGHGNFSQVDPSRFAQAFSRASKHWNTSSSADTCVVAWQRESEILEFPSGLGTGELKHSGEFFRSRNSLAARSRALVSYAGRAPPATTLL